MPRAWLLLLIGILTAGCGPKALQWGGQPVPSPKVVVSLSPGTTEILGSDGNLNQLQGRTESCNYPAFVPTIPVYGGVKPDYEKLAANRPDLIVYDADLYSDADRAKLNDLHLKTFEFKAKNLDEFIAQLRELSKAVNAPMGMSEYVDRIIAERKAGSRPGPRPTLAAVSGTLISGTQSFLADVIKNSGATPAGPDADRFVALNPEVLIQSNPDIILIGATANMDPKDKDASKAAMQKVADQFTSDPRFQSLKAVKQHHVYPIDADVLLRKGCRVDKLIQAIASVSRAVTSG